MGLSLLSLIFILTLALTATSLPTQLDIRGAGIADGLLSQLSLYGQYAAAAYCKGNNNPGAGRPITCWANNCPLVQGAGATSVLEFQDMGPTDTTGFIALDSTRKQIVVTFRGSTSLGNWIGNVNVGLVPWDSCQGCLVHAGFLQSWTDSKNLVVSGLQKAISEHPGYSIVSVGHSLGGAIATLFAAEMRKQGIPVALYTYGSPMVGNDQFANFVSSQSGPNYRVTHAKDIVPKLPGYLLGYRHVSAEYWITSSSGVVVQGKDITICSGIMSLKGNQGQLFSTISDHLWYFNAIAGCDSGFELRKRELELEVDALQYLITDANSS